MSGWKRIFDRDVKLVAAARGVRPWAVMVRVHVLVVGLVGAGCFADNGPLQDGSGGETGGAPVTTGAVEMTTSVAGSSSEATTSGAVDPSGPGETTSGPGETTSAAGTTSEGETTGGPVVPTCPTDKKLLACFRFEDPFNPGLDESSFGNHAAVTGASLVPGQVGTGLDVNAKCVVRAEYADHLVPGQEVTTSAWFFARTLPETDAARMVILDKDANYGIIIRTTGIGCTFHGTPTVQAPVTPNQWTHVTCTHDAQGFTTMYLGGAQYGVPELVGAITETPPLAPLALGNDSPVAKEIDAFDGVIDEVRIWGRVLGEDEIAAQAGL